MAPVELLSSAIDIYFSHLMGVFMPI